MRQLLDSNMDLVVESGYIYLPLLFDPAIEKEIKAPLRPAKPQAITGSPESKTIIKAQGQHFIKTLSIKSLLANYEKIHPDSFKQYKNNCLRKYHLAPEVDSISVDGKLRTILFQIMPHFIKKNRGLDRRRLDETEILDLIAAKINIPNRCYGEAQTFLDTQFLQEILQNLEEQKLVLAPPEDGLLTARQLREWFHKVLDAKILESESERIRKTLQMREQFRHTEKKYIGILLYLAQTESLEIDGFGYSRIGSNGGYLVYKYTGEYVLKDYYARSYLFPDCRVAVSTRGPFRPVVIEKYKHPFLLGYNSEQEICMRNYNSPKKFTADNIIKALEKGINALKYGYDSRRRNGCHSLDRTTVHVRTVDFDDYRI